MKERNGLKKGTDCFGFFPSYPSSTILGKLRIIEIYEFYNMPVLFACKNRTGHIYIAVWIDETQEQDLWLYAPISPERFTMMREGKIDLHDVFTKTEDGFVLEVTVRKTPELFSEIKRVPVEELDESWAPPSGDYLDIPDSLPRVLWEHVDQRNRQQISHDH